MRAARFPGSPRRSPSSPSKESSKRSSNPVEFLDGLHKLNFAFVIQPGFAAGLFVVCYNSHLQSLGDQSFNERATAASVMLRTYFYLALLLQQRKLCAVRKTLVA
jgi:hypothetical protein